jgi:hypothetical protein
MIELIDRKNIFENKKIIASEICKIQKSLYDKDIYLSIDNEKEKMEYLNQFDAVNYETFPVKTNIKTLNISSNEIKTFTKILSDKVLHFFEKTNIEYLFILLDLKMDFFFSTYNKYKPLVNAYKKFEKIIGRKYYNEAFYLKNIYVNEIIDIVFWLSRCSPQMNNIIFFDSMEKYYFNICQYGNIHLIGINESEISEENIKEIGFKAVELCEDNFSTGGKIKGRKMRI